jgi:hypothetical protein
VGEELTGVNSHLQMCFYNILIIGGWKCGGRVGRVGKWRRGRARDKEG